MKWGRKTSSPPSFGGSAITRVFPGSWFSKFKQTGSGSLEATSGKKQQRGKLDLSAGKSSLPREGRFYSLDNDAYWTLSFRKDRGEGKRGNKAGRINPLYESDDGYLVAVSNYKSSGMKKSQLPRRALEGINELDTTETNEEGCSNGIVQESGASGKKKQIRRSRKLRSRVGRRKKKAAFGTGLDEGEEDSSNPKEEESLTELQKSNEVKEESQDSAASKSRNHPNTSRQNFDLSSDGEDYSTSERESALKCQNLESVKVEKINVEAEFQESAYISKRSRNRKIKQKPKKAHGSRSECRIQALAEMKKTRTKLKKKERKEAVTECPTIYNSFAVMKSSFNPQQDFRDSMMEMIKEMGIRHREELEELLACYLTLNCDEHHHLIIDVFQQVWFELNRVIY